MMQCKGSLMVYKANGTMKCTQGVEVLVDGNVERCRGLDGSSRGDRVVEVRVEEGPVGLEGEERMAHELRRPGTHLRVAEDVRISIVVGLDERPDVHGQAVAKKVARSSRQDDVLGHRRSESGGTKLKRTRSVAGLARSRRNAP